MQMERREQSVLLTSNLGTDATSDGVVLFRLRQPISSGAASRGVHRAVARARVAVTNAVFPMSFRPLNATNNTVRVSTTRIAAPTDLLFDPTLHYDPYTLAKTLEQLFRLAGMSVVVRFSPITLGLVLTPESSDVRILAEGTTAWGALGVPRDRELVLPLGVATPMPYPVDLAGPRYLVVSTDLPTQEHEAHDVGGTLAVVPVNASTGQMLVYDPARARYAHVAIDQLAQLRVRITDEFNVPVDFLGVHWSMQLVFEFEQPPRS